MQILVGFNRGSALYPWVFGHAVVLQTMPSAMRIPSKLSAVFFGPLEHFESYTAQGSDGSNNEDPPSVPAPHDAPRKPSMDQGCFEVEWIHKDSCMIAMAALRRVPHLTVTWAHAAPNREAPRSKGPNHPYPIFRECECYMSDRTTCTYMLIFQNRTWLLVPDSVNCSEE
ncbi:hypothetical protein GGU10DRAFT_86120 [Lentinula aff. detonsa]|uniref:Uncharacterized protein n=1 Tax=Lentinula aff. detonsa TaxID=2804958 RepID=A0AA38KMH1_9AGAR|nr:hypothetical protein GGU10DRAFT_86120 [Lentinula aff. detonsa]